MTERLRRGRLQVERVLADFIENDALPRTGLEPAAFWAGFDALVHDFTPRNRQLLAERAHLQRELNGWHAAHPGPITDMPAYRAFLESIGYLQPAPPDFQVDTAGVDTEISTQAGPQLVVPLSNGRYALNAANARWGSLYDALYGTDAIPSDGGAEITRELNPVRAARVVAFARGFLDSSAPLAGSSHSEARAYAVVDGALAVTLADGSTVGLRDPRQFVGFQGEAAAPDAVLLRHHGLHIEIRVDRATPVGATDPAGVADLVLESAVTTIMDCEDSVVAVDGADKAAVYRNWLGIVQGTLTAEVNDGGRSFVRRLAPDREYTAPDGSTLVLPGRALLFLRNVGHLMTNPAVLDEDGAEVFEGLLDAAVTTMISLHDRQRRSNSREGSIYVVKPKMHGPAEVAFADDLFDRVEDMLALPRHTVKLGIMDEERRTSVNLHACIHAARGRIAFINTGFLDRTGDEIHTAMEAGPMARKRDIAGTPWIRAYERSNVLVGLASGLRGRAQIGKGMWAAPDSMAEMLEKKGAQLRAGASTAWVPSPSAATLHALHYHQVDTAAVQREMEKLDLAAERDTLLADLLTIPVADAHWTGAEVQEELDNNCQGLLGYVVRWVHMGMGVSKVPDIRNVGLMEDRATLRISSQHIANWLHHGVITRAQVVDTLRRMAAMVDSQNAGQPGYRPLLVDGAESLAFEAALDLVFNAREQPNGYTEPILHSQRQLQKARDTASV